MAHRKRHVVLAAWILVLGCNAVDFESRPAAQEDPCKNGVLDSGEDEIDCGGQCVACRPAPLDCEGGASCITGENCADGIQNQDETGVDCGGTCARCETDCVCGVPGCARAECETPAASCVDSIRNQGEADVDCGGACDACEDGATCTTAADCESQFCGVGGICAQPPAGCADGIRNQDETDVDCGGGCVPCLEGAACAADADCQSDFCEVEAKVCGEICGIQQDSETLSLLSMNSVAVTGRFEDTLGVLSGSLVQELSPGSLQDGAIASEALGPPGCGSALQLGAGVLGVIGDATPLQQNGTGAIDFYVYLPAPGLATVIVGRDELNKIRRSLYDRVRIRRAHCAQVSKYHFSDTAMFLSQRGTQSVASYWVQFWEHT